MITRGHTERSVNTRKGIFRVVKCLCFVQRQFDKATEMAEISVNTSGISYSNEPYSPEEEEIIRILEERAWVEMKEEARIRRLERFARYLAVSLAVLVGLICMDVFPVHNAQFPLLRFDSDLANCPYRSTQHVVEHMCDDSIAPCCRLGWAPSLTEQVIGYERSVHKVYRNLAKIVHSDRKGGSGEKMVCLTAAHSSCDEILAEIVSFSSNGVFSGH